MPKYEPMIGIRARTRLNELGYAVQGVDDADQAKLGLIVVLAEQVQELREEIEKLKAAQGPI